MSKLQKLNDMNDAAIDELHRRMTNGSIQKLTSEDMVQRITDLTNNMQKIKVMEVSEQSVTESKTANDVTRTPEERARAEKALAELGKILEGLKKL
jgi:hypothetical protein